MSVYWHLNNKHQNKKMTNDLQMNKDTKIFKQLTTWSEWWATLDWCGCVDKI